MPTRTHLARMAAAAVAVALVPGVAAEANGDGDHDREPELIGRAVLPVASYADGPQAGAFFTGAPRPQHVINSGIQFPLPSQPLEGFSAIVDGRSHGEYLAMADNGFGTKENSFDFLIRAYYVRPDFKTRHGGSGAVDVDADEGEFISFGDPNHKIKFDIVNKDDPARLLTGADIDPESLQRGRNGDLWVGDEFGPWILHFDADGVLLEAPIELPGGLAAATNPDLGGRPVTVNGSRGIEAMAMSPNRRYLYVVLEGAVINDLGTYRRVFEYDTRNDTFTRLADYQTDVAAHFVADAQALDNHRLLVIERDNVVAAVRNIYEVDLRDVDDAGNLRKTLVVNLAAIGDPDGVSLPPIHEGDVGLGDPYRVTCESVEALHIISHNRLLVGCDNNFPNRGRNPNLADDNEFIVVKV
jgi:hypothetical protein